ncbi:hypothetical protein AB733_14260 [Photobacterium swingsii]|uniref:DUF1496 domain-containing protein n=2 Tax=Photobacterium swingsii TaxID=680026 RepID=A0A0J8VC43_9GAMM|nr:hypothetical protein AB733_14260 [Photobacterium swingsii]PSW23006.1 DUF1496 domain-containing protein [Photobacterium swingsii]
MKGILILVGALCMSASVHALESKTISTGTKAKVHLDVQGVGKRVCFYDDKAYSLGSVIKVENVLLECLPEKEFEQNGALRWHKVGA